ncbi:MAG: Hsp20/alpha crystallin family protein [Patescibacteria group bacterium]|jgi:HSP20 family protein
MNGLTKWRPFFEPFEDMEGMFSDFMPALRARQSRGGFVPAIDMYEDKDNVIVEAPLAGMDPEKVDISIENDVLTIKGESEKKSEVEDKNYYRKEIQRGSFYRSVPLPMRVSGDKASAIAEGGVLKISIPKAPEAKSNKVRVNVK